MRPGLAAALVAVLAASFAAGCSRGEDSAAPAPCTTEASAFVAALADAPAPVRLEGRVPISECLQGGQSADQLNVVGAAMVEAASLLNRRARARPGGQANIAAGYLIGAAERGAGSGGGIHADLIRRLGAAVGFTGRPSAAFERALARGRAAGLRSG